MSLLLSPLTIRGRTLKNRLVVSPMCQYSARGGMANDWHFAHLARFGIGGWGTVIVEATAVSPEGRISYADLGLWNDAQVAPLARIVDFLHGQGAAAGIQLGHSGRKGATPLWWRGSFNETEEEKPRVGFEDWVPVAPSAIRHTAEPSAFKVPRELTSAEIDAIRDGFAAAAGRAARAGFDVVEVHAAHGYLLNQFLSPIANHRTDRYGGSRENQMRFPLEVVEAVRATWPADRPLFLRLSAVDALPGGVTLDDTLSFARQAVKLGVDMVVCSSGGFEGASLQPAPLYQVPHARALRQAGLPTMAVGLITEPQEAEGIIAAGDADMVALGRMALDDPNWPLHARRSLGGAADPYADWAVQCGFAVRNKDRALGRLMG